MAARGIDAARDAGTEEATGAPGNNILIGLSAAVAPISKPGAATRFVLAVILSVAKNLIQFATPGLLRRVCRRNGLGAGAWMGSFVAEGAPQDDGGFLVALGLRRRLAFYVERVVVMGWAREHGWDPSSRKALLRMTAVFW